MIKLEELLNVLEKKVILTFIKQLQKDTKQKQKINDNIYLDSSDQNNYNINRLLYNILQVMSVRCSHILQKHKGSRRPFDSNQKPITRTLEQAINNINNFLSQVKDNPKLFAQIAQKYSQCSSAKVGGDLGRFEEGQMQKKFEQVAFKLKVGEISGPVQTDSGVHIIYRTQ